ncbi:MAG: hypothetical protein LBC11_01900 [Puniceicoccales bacterium]|jgi:hypothetical protein|nr:hypothetical protein [Puniceicoccales bacterium]
MVVFDTNVLRMIVRNGRGVALIFVVLVLLLIGGIFTNIATLNYIEILRLRKETNVNRAKDMALFALGLAVERLQKLTGCDTCATALAGSIGNVSGGKKYYVGVWNSSEKRSDGEQNFLGWLVSDKNSENFDSVFYDESGKAEKIFSSGMGDDVYIKPVDLKNSNEVVGQYGFWICDESQKIKINQIDRYSQSSDSRARKIRCCCPQTFDVDTIFGKNNRIKNNFILTKFDFPEQLSYLDLSDKKVFSRNSHILTLHSYGVLGDAKRGGLRQDLSQMANRKISNGPRQYLFAPQTELPAYIPTLEFLLSFFDLSNGLKNNGIPVFATDPMFRPQMFKNYDGATIDLPGNDLQSATTHGIYPLIVQSNVNIGVTTIDGHFAFTFIPQIVLWNPYDVDLQPTNYVVELCVPYNDPANTTGLTLLGFNSIQQSFVNLVARNLTGSQPANDVSPILKLKFSSSFRAGETKIFSLSNSQAIDWNKGNQLSSTDDLSNFIYMDTGVPTGGYNTIRLQCRNANGSINKHWDCFYWRLRGDDGKILQEIAELDPRGNERIECERTILDGNINCFAFCSRMKYGILGDADGGSGVRWLAMCNPRAQYINRAVCQGYSSIFFQGNFISGNWNWDTHIISSATPMGLDREILNYLDGLVLFDVPDATCGILNIGHLRHINFLPFGYFSSQIFGSSRASPFVPINKTFHENIAASTSWPSQGKVESLYDYSYLLNGTIFDRYFISTERGQDTGDDSLPSLANKRFKLAGNVSSTNGENLAQILLIDGPFNVNSTTPIAWQCVLSSAKNEYDDVVFPRFYSEKFPNKMPSFDERKIKNLSEKLTDLMKKRHKPFFSIGEFVNRTIVEDPAQCSREGILQKAIDDSKLNAAFENHYVNFSKNISSYDNTSASGFLEENLPNVVNQADILQTTSHFLCTRGDTFLVRALGNHVDSRGKVIEQAYCEAVVQRVPEYVNKNENAPGDTGENLSKINKKFGRRYKIILFRWLDGGDI